MKIKKIPPKANLLILRWKCTFNKKCTGNSIPLSVRSIKSPCGSITLICFTATDLSNISLGTIPSENDKRRLYIQSIHMFQTIHASYIVNMLL